MSLSVFETPVFSSYGLAGVFLFVSQFAFCLNNSYTGIVHINRSWIKGEK